MTRAADRIGLSQPVMSKALGPRHLRKDELLVRTATGMEPMPWNSSDQLGVLHEIEHMLSADSGYDPRTSNRKSALRMSDLLEYLMLHQLSLLRHRAPKINACDVVL